MDDAAKITLSEAELDKVCDKEWILTKQRITEKVYDLLGLHAAAVRQAFAAHGDFFGAEITGSFPKISKGENYLQMPYVMLDYPSVFGRDHIFALRTMFWWGNFFSCTLLLKGHYADTFRESIIHNLQKGSSGIYICIGHNEWDHHFEAGNYVPASEYNMEELGNRSFIKLAIKYDLEKWNEMRWLLEEGAMRLAGLMISPAVI
ncbi:hypothetical protein [Ferruginibacter sp. HRS2-29]|uniref:hypothetical protein n=1 Tax=Ferruginibacter sp. HRS2-29 TaxID=2487334 RepID=UPI0020CCE07A|nr:hypothetical protein [Ferruginibacter sp. HRS2-29]MCP9750655.1 hypothetical protein [Ferruginibacter sp. HRS2-29]